MFCLHKWEVKDKQLKAYEYLECKKCKKRKIKINNTSGWTVHKYPNWENENDEIAYKKNIGRKPPNPPQKKGFKLEDIDKYLGCKICKSLLEDKKISIAIRSTYADDNICEYVRDEDCEDCDGCNAESFIITPANWDNELWIGFEYNRRVPDLDKKDEGLIIRPFTERIPFNYCFHCGKKINEKNDVNNKISEYSVKIEE